MNGLRKLCIWIPVILFLLAGPLAPDQGLPARARQLDATPPYIDWYEDIEWIEQFHQAETPHNGYVYAVLNNQVLVYDSSNLNVLHQVGQSSTLDQAPVAMIGRGAYLYATTSSGKLFVLSLADPRNPELINTVSINQNAGRVLSTASGLVVRYTSSVQPINLSNPAAPVVGSSITTGTIRDLTVDGNHLYIASGMTLKWVNLSSPGSSAQTIYTSTKDILQLDVKNGVGVLANWDNVIFMNLSNPASPTVAANLYHKIFDSSEIALIAPHVFLFSRGMLHVVNLANLSQPKLLTSRALITEIVESGISIKVDGTRLYITRPNQGITVVDITVPSQPAVLAQWGKSSILDVEIDGNYLYTVNRRGYLGIYDLGGTGNPILQGELPIVSSYYEPYGVPGNSSNITDIKVKNGFALVIGYFFFNIRLVVVDVRNPSHPKVIGNLDYNFPLRDIEWYGNYAYAVGGYNSNEIHIINLSDPGNPVKVGSFSTSGRVNNLAVKNGGLYFADQSAGLKIYSLTNPTAPTHLATLPIDFQDPYGVLTPNGVTLYKHYVLVHGGSSIAVVNVQNPSNPVQVSVFDKVPSSRDDIAVIGDQVFLSGYGGKTYIVNLGNPQSPVVTHRSDLPDTCKWKGAAFNNNLFLSVPDLCRLKPSSSAVYSFTHQNRDQPAALTSPQDSVSYSFAPFSFNPGFFSHTPLTGAQAPAVPANLRRIVTPFKNNRSGHISLYYQFQMTYTDAQIAGVLETSLALYYWDGLAWIAEPTSSVNVDSNILTANPEQTGIWMVAGTPATTGLNQTITSVMLPIIMRPPNLDLILADIEITQAVQDVENSLPLVQNRSTVLRAIVRTNQIGGTRDVFLSVSASRNGQNLPGSPLISGPWTLKTYSGRGLFENTPYIHLPQEWLNGNVNLTVHLDPHNQFAENNESNNVLSVNLTFTSVPPLHIVIVPVRYTHTPSGQVFEPITYDSISWHNMEVYPVPGLTTEIHSPINFSGSLSNYSSWSALLNTITSIKNSEGRARGIIYYGVVPTEIFAGYTSYIGGVAWLGHRASVGIDSFDIMSHEIGHNFGLEHTFDNPQYPYTYDRIGASGFNVFTRSVYPGEFSADLMSYEQEPTWISDYYYLQVYNDQRQNGTVSVNETPDEAILLVSGTVSAEGWVKILPTYSLPDLATRIAAQGQLQVALFSTAGRELARHPLEVFQIAEEDHDIDIEATAIGRFDAVLPLPDEPVAAVRIYEGGTLRAERYLHPGGLNMLQAEIISAETGTELAWQNSDHPVLLRASWDGGQTWQVLAVDLVGGRYELIPEWFPDHLVRFQIIPADQGRLERTGIRSTEIDMDELFGKE